MNGPDHPDPAGRAAARAPRKQLRSPGLAAPRRILLVEDDFMLRQHMAELLAAEGYAVSSAADGAEALRLLEREPAPFAIILDIGMPRMNGISFREAQLESPTLRTIPTIVVSAIRPGLDLESLHFTEVIAKPAPFDRLVEALAKLCPAT